MPATDPALDPSIVQRAAEWMARLWADDASAQDQADCAHWRAENPLHELAWQRLQGFDDRLQAVPRELARHALREPAADAWRERRRALGLLGVVGIAGGLLWQVHGSDAWQMANADQRTATGQIRTIALPDGTQVVLASASAIDLRFDDTQRLIVLRGGEILVTSASDPAPHHRPLRVQTRHGSVQALGTRFSLRQEGDATHVAVFDGAVEVRPTHAPHQAVRIHSGQGASFSAEHVQPIAPVPASAAAWANGMLVADGMPLGDLVAELARYRPGLLQCDAAVARLRVTGVFPLRDTDRALENLSLALPVQVQRRTRYWVMVQGR